MLCRKAEHIWPPRGHTTKACLAVLLLCASLVSMALLADRSWLDRGGPAPPCCLYGSSWLGQSPLSVELVLAHYNENVTWLEPFLAKLGVRATLTTYSKGPHPPAGAKELPNVGREGHTYLQHLHTQYDSLAGVTLFLMGSAGYSEDKEEKLAEILEKWQQAQHTGFFCAGLDFAAPTASYTQDEWMGTTESGSNVRLELASLRPFGRWFAEYIGGELPKAWCPASMMAVHRSRARQRPRSFYKALLEQMSVARSLETGHYLERSWASIFFAPEAMGCLPKPGFMSTLRGAA